MRTGTELKIKVPAPQAEIAGAIANMVVPYGIYMEDYSHLEEEALEIAHIDLIDEELLQKDREHAIIHIYISPEANPAEAVSFLEERFQAENIPYEIDRDSCVEEDWINNWKKYFPPHPRWGEKLLIRPLLGGSTTTPRAARCSTWSPAWPWHRHPRDHPPVPGALGEVRHPRHRLFGHGLRQRHPVGGGPAAGGQVRRGVDIDPLAVKTAVENAETNGVAERFTGICGNLAEKVTGKFQVVAANIVADIVILLSKDAPRFLTPDSTYIVSGIIDTREQDVLAAIQDTFQVIERREEKGWVAMALKLK